MSERQVQQALNNFALRRAARKRLPKWLFEFVDRGREEEVALRNNRAAFERIKLRTQVLVDVSKRKPEVELFGRKQDLPIGNSPTGPAGMLWYKGELELARAAKAAGISNARIGESAINHLSDARPRPTETTAHARFLR